MLTWALAPYRYVGAFHDSIPVCFAHCSADRGSVVRFWQLSVQGFKFCYHIIGSEAPQLSRNSQNAPAKVSQPCRISIVQSLLSTLLCRNRQSAAKIYDILQSCTCFIYFRHKVFSSTL